MAGPRAGRASQDLSVTQKCAVERRIRDFNNDPELTQYVETISELEDFGVATIHDPEEGRKLNVAVLPERENDRAEIYFQCASNSGATTSQTS